MAIKELARHIDPKAGARVVDSSMSCAPGFDPAGRQAFLDSVAVCGSFEVQSRRLGAQAASWRLLSAVFLCCFSPLLYGFAMGFTSPAQLSMEGGDAPPHLSVFSPAQFTAYAAAINVGGVVGAFAGAAAMDRIGRRRALALSALPHAVAWLGTALGSEPVPLTLLRVLSGFGVGMGTAVAPCYIGEVAPAHLRGVLGVTIQLSMNVGRLFVNAAGAFALVVGECFCDWRRLSLCGAAFAAALAAMACAPESPKWLARRGDAQAARLALRALRDGDTAAEEAELQAMAEGSEKGSVSETSAPAHRLRDYKRSLVVAVGLMCFQQLSGINAIMMYAMDICAQAGMQSVRLSCIRVMSTQVVLGMLPLVLVQRIGRRALLQFAGLTMCVSHLGLAYDLMARERSMWTPPWLSLASLSLYVVGFSLGMEPVPWIVLPKLFPVEVVGAASAIATGVGWSFAFIVCVEFRALQASLGAHGVFLLFAMFCLACFVFVTCFVPETKGKTVEEVLAALHERRSDVRSLSPKLAEDHPKAFCSA